MSNRAFLILILGICVMLSAIGVASAETPAVAEPGNLRVTFNGGFTPKALPREVLAPVSLSTAGKVQTKDGSQPPPLREFTLELDENVEIDLEGYPICRPNVLQIRRSVKEMRKLCEDEDAIVGEGSLAVSVAFPEQPPIPATSELLLLNGEGASGKPALYAYASITQPITTAITTPVKIRRQKKNGRLRTKVAFEFPPIANGAGSVTSFNLTVSKGLKLKGKPFSILSAKCPDGHLSAHSQAIFKDGTKAEAEVTRPCTGKG
jgi:hypothetical protein